MIGKVTKTKTISFTQQKRGHISAVYVPRGLALQGRH